MTPEEKFLDKELYLNRPGTLGAAHYFGKSNHDIIISAILKYAEHYHQKEMDRKIAELEDKDLLKSKRDDAYENAGENAYFGTGFDMGAKLVLEKLREK